MPGAAMVLTGALVLACVEAAPAPPERTELRVVPGFGGESDGRAESWSLYARARIDGPVELSARRGSPDPPSFAEEVFARAFLARAWTELAARRGWRDRYLEELAVVEAAGWMREYSWECLHVLRGLEPADLDVESFRDWLEAALPDHQVETWVTARTEGDHVAFEVGREAHAPYHCGRVERADQLSGSSQAK